MIEKHIVIDEIDPRVLYGANNTYLRMLKALYPTLRIVARDNVIKPIGDELAITDFESTIELLFAAEPEFNCEIATTCDADYDANSSMSGVSDSSL